MLIIKVKYDYVYDGIKITKISIHESIENLMLSTEQKSTLRKNNATFDNRQSLFCFIYGKEIKNVGSLKSFYDTHHIGKRVLNSLRKYKLRNIYKEKK